MDHRSSINHHICCLAWSGVSVSLVQPIPSSRDSLYKMPPTHHSLIHPPSHTPTPDSVLTANAGLHVCVSVGDGAINIKYSRSGQSESHLMDTLADHPHLNGNTRLVNIPVVEWRDDVMCPREGGCFTEQAHTQTDSQAQETRHKMNATQLLAPSSRFRSIHQKEYML